RITRLPPPPGPVGGFVFDRVHRRVEVSRSQVNPQVRLLIARRELAPQILLRGGVKRPLNALELLLDRRVLLGANSFQQNAPLIPPHGPRSVMSPRVVNPDPAAAGPLDDRALRLE